MSVELVNCPSCGASLDINSTEEFVKCKFCSSTIRVQRRNVNSDGSTTLTDKATGMVIGTVRVPFGYQAQGMLLPGISSYTYPMGISASAYDEKGTAVSYFIGEAYCDRSKCPMLSGMYSQGMEQISRTHYKNFMDVR
jgi:DNA-directed RNA polymerase subunit RPC12/RpoP